MFKSIVPPPDKTITVFINGVSTPARTGQTVASLLMEHNHKYTRHTAVSNTPRSPYCFMGACYDCLMEIDGTANVQACLTIVADQMQIRYQHGTLDTAHLYTKQEPTP